MALRKPKLVLMTADTIGGVWTYALDLAGGLQRAGVATVLATMGRPLSPAQRQQAAGVPGLVVEESRLKLEWMPDAGEDVALAGDWLLDLEQRYAPALVHVNGYAHAALPWSAPRVAVAHSCVGSWWRAVRREPLPPEWHGYTRRVTEGLRAAEVVVAPTAAFLDSLQELYGPLPRARVIHNGRSADAFRPRDKVNIIVGVGRVWDEAKNVAALDAVAGAFHWPIVVAGDWRRPEGGGEPPANLLCLNTLSEEDVAAWLARAAIFALPARYEPFGLAALEAGLSGCALVLGDIPTLRELWEGAAVFVPPDDHAALREALRELIADPARRAELGRIARARGAQLTVERMVTGYLGAYADAIAHRGAGTGARADRGRRLAARPRSDLALRPGMRFVLFCHSLVSDWNHGNAHFLRGVVRELRARGHGVRVYEPRGGWSRANLVAERGEAAIRRFEHAFPGVRSIEYDPDGLDPDAALAGADVVIVHEWTDPALVARIGAHRARGARYRLLFHDTHHRSVSDPEATAAFDLDGFDGVLAFGEAVREVYLRRGWARQVWTWHEAADTALFRPLPAERRDGDLVWIGNWGDGERSEELGEFLLEPIRRLGLKARIHGVRYPKDARRALRAAGATYGGWLANADVPATFARYGATVHVPRRYYATLLPGVPTIRVFEALACGIPLLSAPWDDAEGLFRPGRDYLVARDGDAMTRALRDVLADRDLAAGLARSGLETIRARHTCGHRVEELLAICRELGVAEPAPAAAGAA